MNYKNILKTITLALISSVFLTSGSQVYSFSDHDVGVMYRNMEVHEKYHHSVKKIHEDIYARLKIIQAMKEEEMKSRIITVDVNK
jgi:hypothetical protein